MLRNALWFVLFLSAVPAHAGLFVDDPSANESRDAGVVTHGDLDAFFEFHRHSDKRDFGSRQPGEFAWAPGVECRVLHDTAPVAQWIARPPPKGQVAGSIPARGTNSISSSHRSRSRTPP